MKSRVFMAWAAMSVAGCSDLDASSSVSQPTGASQPAPPGVSQQPPPSSQAPVSYPPLAPFQPPLDPQRVSLASSFVLADSDPFSTFAADVDTASYDIFRRSLALGTLPNPSEVRVEEYVNFFHYEYETPAPISDLPFAIALSAGRHIAGAPTTLLRVGIQGASHEKLPANLVFLVDISGSMAAPNKLPLVKTVLHEALTLLAPTDRVSIVTYAGGTRVALGPTEARERALIDRAIDALDAAGGTNGASGIELAYQQAQHGFVEEGINHVVLCTDGDFNLGVSSDDALVRMIEDKRKSGVTLTALGFGERNNDTMMERVSNAGNGIYSVLYDRDQAIAYTHRRLLSTMIHIAKDVKIKLELNPQHVYAYRLIGYEDRQLTDQQFQDDRADAGEIGSGHQVTALFELALKSSDLPVTITPSSGEPSESTLERQVSSEELVRVSVRFKRPGAAESEPSREVRASLGVADIAGDDTLDADAVWAMGVASLAELLRQGPYAHPLDLGKLRDRLAPLVGTSSERAEFVALLSQAQQLVGH